MFAFHLSGNKIRSGPLNRIPTMSELTLFEKMQYR
jgi:hypothetical protein